MASAPPVGNVSPVAHSQSAPSVSTGQVVTPAGQRDGGDPLAAVSSTHMPIRLLEVELAEPLPAASLVDRVSGQRYGSALSLVRLHGRPLGYVSLPATEPEIGADAYAAAIWQALGPQILAHLRADNLPPIAALDRDGVLTADVPRCRRDRDAYLADAPLVSVIVATRDRPASLAGCLRALARLTYPRYEVIVVDNAPRTSATLDLVRARAADFADLRYLREDRPGQAQAQNSALPVARGEIVAFTDDDAFVDPQWLSELVYGFGAGDQVACVTGLVVPYELETPAQVWFEQYGGMSKGFTHRLFDLHAHRPEDRLFPYTAGRLGVGASMAFRSSVLHAMGGFDPALGPGSPALGGADVASFFDVMRRGHQLVYQPSALVYHQHRREYEALRDQIHTWGVGFTAFLTRCIARDPRVVLDLLRKLPDCVVAACTVRSRSQRRQTTGYPEEFVRGQYPRGLRLAELRGLPYGPVAYTRGRRRSAE
jgi:GT2 family glycosyltransferase